VTPVQVLRDACANLILKRFTPLAPTVMVYNVTYRCNARCVMCENWKKASDNEITAKEFNTLLENPLFRDIEYLSISGGEPTLKEDLPSLVEIIVKKLPALKKMGFNTTGLTPSLVRERCAPIVQYCAESGVSLSLRVSIDGIGEIHDRIRNVPGAFEKAEESLHILMKLSRLWPFQPGISSTISQFNYSEVEHIYRYCAERELDAVFYFAMISEGSYNNEACGEDLAFSDEGRDAFVRFLEKEIRRQPFFSPQAYLYEKLIPVLEGDPVRRMPCPFMDQGVVLDPDGSIRYCLNSKRLDNILEKSPEKVYYSADNLRYRKKMARTLCSRCHSPCFTGVALRKEILPAFSFIMRRIYSRIGTHARR
jgi:MoaA/NifB/PqqE/SkfB family radical SAM enzyme